MIYIVRNNQQFGPYSIDDIVSYVTDGKILLSDKAFESNNSTNIRTVRYFIKLNGKKVKIKNAGSLIKQLKVIGSELIFPKSAFQKKQWIADKKLLVLALIGLLPIFVGKLSLGSFFLFYSIALYFSIIWGLFFYYLFRTNQVTIRQTTILFFFTQISVFFLWDILQLPNWPIISTLYGFTKSDFFFSRFIGYFLGVGLFEELVKALPLVFYVTRIKEPVLPQTLVFYGLMSGVAFGVFEGVQYQMTINAQLRYDQSFFMNIARLTSLPFLHAVWCGIAGYFIAFANLYPKYRLSLFFLAILIPAAIHGLYDFLGWSLLGLGITLAGVMLLTTYLKQGVNYQSKLSK